MLLNINKIKKLLCVTSFIVAIGMPLQAQQDPMYTQYMFNALALNPAYAGTHPMMSAALLYRNQWVSMPGAPVTGTFTVDAPLMNQKVGAGLSVVLDKIGVTKRTGIMGSYSYKMSLNTGTLAAGLQFGFNFYNTNYTNVDYSQTANNDAAFQNNSRGTYPGLGVGLYYYTDRFYTGISMPQFVSKSFINNIMGKSDANSYEQANHLFLTSGYVFDINRDFKIKPSVMLKYVNGAPLEADFSVTGWFYDMFAIGLSYRSMDSFTAFTEIMATRQLFLGYAYEYAITDLHLYNSGTHELMLRYQFDFARARIVTPRYF